MKTRYSGIYFKICGIVFLLGLFMLMPCYSQEKKWEYLGNRTFNGSELTLSENSLFILDFNRNILCLERETGKKLWETDIVKQLEISPFRMMPFTPVYMKSVQGKGILLVSDCQNLFTVDEKTGKKIWAIKIESLFFTEPIVHCERIFICTLSGELHQIALTTGHVIKKSRIDIPSSVNDIPAVNGEILFLSGGSHDAKGEVDANLLVFKIRDNTKIWEKKLKSTEITAALSQQYFLLLEENKSLSCLDKRTGKIYWEIREGPKYAFKDMPAGRPVLSGKNVFWHSSFSVYAYNFQNGDELWSYDAGAVLKIYVAGEKVYVISVWAILCLDKISGKPLWRIENDFYDTNPVYGEGVFYGLYGNKISAVIPPHIEKLNSFHLGSTLPLVVEENFKDMEEYLKAVKEFEKSEGYQKDTEVYSID